MTDELNKQIVEETYSAYLYFAMSAYCAVGGLKGAANWLFVQGQEELTHAWRIYLYVMKQGQQAILGAIQKPPQDFKSLLNIFEATLKHEQHITARINLLSNLARQEKDHASEIFLQWFVNEQVEEEENATDILARVKLAGKDGSALFMVDNELAARTFVMPPDLPGGAPAAGA
jgi:ferritin